MSTTPTPQVQYPEIVEKMALTRGLTPALFWSTLKSQVFPADANTAQMVHFLLIADKYDLDPFAKEIWPFPSKNGIIPVPSVDGWNKVITRNEDYDGCQYEYMTKDPADRASEIVAVTCRIFRKSHKYPTEATEFLKECRRNTPMWSQWPVRMLKHKARIQAAREAFALSGIYDQDEAERIGSVDRPEESTEQANTNRLAALKDKLRATVPEPDKEKDAARKESAVEEAGASVSDGGTRAVAEAEPAAAEARKPVRRKP